jgi:hypothetical protein
MKGQRLILIILICILGSLINTYVVHGDTAPYILGFFVATALDILEVMFEE